MKKTVFVLLNDYWHPRATIEPLVEKLFPEKDWFLRVTDDPNYPTAYFKMPDLLVNFKDGIANTQIPTSNWYGRDWAFVLERAIWPCTAAPPTFPRTIPPSARCCAAASCAIRPSAR